MTMLVCSCILLFLSENNQYFMRFSRFRNGLITLKAFVEKMITMSVPDDLKELVGGLQ